jgi:type III pantothenate kinase
MLLTIDVGNSTTVVGLHARERLVRRWRITTTERTPDEFVLLLSGMIAPVEGRLTGAAVASVVPAVVTSLRHALAELVDGPVVVLGPGVRTGLAIKLDNPREVGADRVANAIGAIDRFGAPVVAVDFGTATTVDLVDPDGAYVGGVIAPGVRTGAEALVEATAALRRVELVVPRRVVGRNTSEAIQSGLTHGFASLVDGLVARIVEEQGLVDVPVVATGGLAEVVAPLCRTVTAIDDDLTLRGLRIVYERNAT